METALARSDNQQINSLLDSAMAEKMLSSPNTPSIIRQAANQTASKQLRQAMQAEPINVKELKGALVTARRLYATGVPEFAEASAKYKELKRLPPGWDLDSMKLHVEGNMLARMEMNDPEVMANFQQLLDATHRKVYTRDRRGGQVPEGFELVSVNGIANADLWAKYVTRREEIRLELEADPSDFATYQVKTASEEGLASITQRLADDFS